jgi:hypothetical protein
MKSAVSVLFAAVLLAACASSDQTSSGPNVSVQLRQVNTPTDVFYFSGPVALQYEVDVTNPTPDPLTLERLDLSSVGPGAYSVRTSGTPMNLKVPPNSTARFMISVWGRARGGYLAASEPVTIRGTAYFRDEATRKPFVRIFTENVIPS